jgi:hypothetical protein
MSGATIAHHPPASASSADPATSALPVGAHSSRLVDGAACFIFVGYALLLFRLSLFEGWTFVGDSDRLNNIMNLRLFEVTSILERGSIPAWNEHEFMGYGVSGVHWMLPGAPPLPQLLALLPLSEFYHALAILAAALFAATMLAAYWCLGAYSAGPVPRIVGALLYATGAYTVHKLMQLDLSYAALVAPPLLHRLVLETRRERASWMFLGMAACWSFLVTCTVLQEVAYIGLFWGLYALFRSLRLRTPWPVVVAGLAFVVGVTIATPRIVTIATELSVVSRTSQNVQTRAIEAVRYFGDGLLGRTQGEQSQLGIPSINMHEGVQLLGSSLAGLAVIAYGLVASSRWPRFWSAALLVVVSVALNGYFRAFYELEALGLRNVTYPSRELRTVVVNAVAIGVPAWLLGWWLTRRAASHRAPLAPSHATHQESDGLTTDGSPPMCGGASSGAGLPSSRDAEAEDLSFLFGFVVLALAVILVPEARLILYYAFMRLDFLHSRISVAMTLPLAAIAVMLLNRFLPARYERVLARWSVLGLLIGAALWLGLEPIASGVVGQVGPALRALRPWPLLTLESVRVVGSLLVLLVALSLLVRRTRASWRTVAGGVLASWMVLETCALADHRLNGPMATEQIRPYATYDYMQVPAGQLRAPSLPERAALQERLETDRYRSILLEDHYAVPPRADAHLAAFWGLRLVEGYSTGSPRRYEHIPWGPDIATPHYTDLHAMQGNRSIPWSVLALLNVKYAVTVDLPLWSHAGPGGPVPRFELSKLRVVENPYPVAPRAFFAARITPARSEPKLAGDNGRRPPPENPPLERPERHSVAEGLSSQLQLSADGTIDAHFDGDHILVRVDPAGGDRFLVLNEMYHPTWQATVDGLPTTIYPTNLVMRGILVPAGATTIELTYAPFVYTPAGYRIMVAGVLLTLVLTWGLRSVDLVPRPPFLIWR